MPYPRCQRHYENVVPYLQPIQVSYGTPVSLCLWHRWYGTRSIDLVPLWAAEWTESVKHIKLIGLKTITMKKNNFDQTKRKTWTESVKIVNVKSMSVMRHIRKISYFLTMEILKEINDPFIHPLLYWTMSCVSVNFGLWLALAVKLKSLLNNHECQMVWGARKYHHHLHYVPGLLQTSAIMSFQSSVSSVLLMSSLLVHSFLIIQTRHAYRPEKIGTVLKICDKIKSVLPFCLILSRS